MPTAPSREPNNVPDGTCDLRQGPELGGYEVLSLIGAGGMGEAYAARDGRLGRLVALKVLPERFSSHPERLARFEREARVLAAPERPTYRRHPRGGTRATESPRSCSRWWMCQRSRTVSAEGPIPIDETLALAAQIASALEAAHQHGFIHRDLKPSNIKLRADGTIKLLDFGLAKALDPMVAGGDLNDPTVTHVSGVAIGTPAYMAPEQARGLAIDKSVDIWAFGCVLYEMLTGKQPFGSGDRSGVQTAVNKTLWNRTGRRCRATVPPAVRMPPTGCLRADPKLRIRDIGDVRLAMSGHLDMTASQSYRRERPPRTATLGGALVLAAAVLLAFAGVAAWQNVADARNSRAMTFLLDAPDGSRFDRSQRGTRLRRFHLTACVSPSSRHTRAGRSSGFKR